MKRFFNSVIAIAIAIGFSFSVGCGGTETKKTTPEVKKEAAGKEDKKEAGK